MHIAGYEIIDKVAEGGMATVYLAVQASTGEQVALKVLSPELASDSSIAQQFLDEGEIVARLEHPNIIRLLDVGESNGHYYLSMELMVGGNLKSSMRQGMTEDEAIKVVSQVGRALIYAHKQNVLHLDVTPHNILFHTSGVAVLTDFGIAKQYSEDDTEAKKKLVLGNPRYMSPEQIKGEQTSPRSDLYSLGVVFYEMLTGQVPFQADDAVKTARMHLFEEPPRLPEHYSKYQAIIDCLLEKISDRRFSSVESFLSALNAFSARQTVSAEDKTIVFPVQKAIAAGGILSVTGVADHTMELDTEEVLKNAEDNTNNKFPDSTDPMSVDEVLNNEQPAKNHQSIERALKRFEDYSFVQEDIAPEAVNVSAETNRKKDDVTQEKEFKAADISSPLVAVREGSTNQLETSHSKLSDFFYFLSYQRDTVAKLFAVIVSVLVAGYLYLNYFSTDQNIARQDDPVLPGSVQNEPEVKTTPDKLVIEEKSVLKETLQKNVDQKNEEIEEETAIKIQSQTQAQKQIGNNNKETSLKDKPTETVAPVLQEDSGLVFSNGRYIINTGLERILKNNVRNVVRDADGSLKIFLDRSQLYQADSASSNQKILQLYAKLSYIFRNQKDFKVVVTDRTTHVDTPEGFRLSLNNANNIADYFIGYGLSANRIRGDANSRQYQGSFNGTEISLKPNY